MSIVTKRRFALFLAVITAVSLLGGCANQPSGTMTESEEATQMEEKTTLKVLTIGNSASVDSCYMLSLIAAAEGYTELTVGTLYYSGCSLSTHVKFMSNNAREYKLYVSKSADVSTVRDTIDGVTMSDAVRYTDWDVFILQAAGFEDGLEQSYSNGNIQALQRFVGDNKLNPNAVFGWHMFWPIATDPDLMATHPTKPYPFTSRWEKFDFDRDKLYAACTECVRKYILTDETFKFVIPSGTAIQNAMSGYMTEKDLLRDYAHLTDLGRIIAGYYWFCILRGIDELQELKLSTVPKAYFKSTVSSADWVLSDHEKALILESVNNTLKNPLQVTASQYTQAPTP